MIKKSKQNKFHEKKEKIKEPNRLKNKHGYITNKKFPIIKYILKHNSMARATVWLLLIYPVITVALLVLFNCHYLINIVKVSKISYILPGLIIIVIAFTFTCYEIIKLKYTINDFKNDFVKNIHNNLLNIIKPLLKLLISLPKAIIKLLFKVSIYVLEHIIKFSHKI